MYVNNILIRGVCPMRNAKKSRGQGMVEYIVIVGLIAVSAIAVFGLFGKTIKSQVAGMASEVAGQNGSTAVSNASTAAGSAVTKANTANNMSTYTGQNQ